jgi:hypothetical protein
MRSLRGAPRGQATIETILLTWIMVVFFAAAFQLFVVNDAIYKAVSAAHRQLFARAFQLNCADQSNSDCHYSRDRARIVWDAMAFPEIRVPTVPVFRRVTGLPDELLIQNGPNRPKESYIGTGTAGPGTTLGPADLRLAEKVLEVLPVVVDIPRILRVMDDRFGG